jgi:hypothetical protein
MDPAEMLWECSIHVICADEDVVVEITECGAGSSPPADHVAALRGAPSLSRGATYSPGRLLADRHAA